MPDNPFADQKGKEQLRRDALAETQSAQRFIHAQEETRKRQHKQTLEMELNRLESEIQRVERDRMALVHEEEGIKRKEVDARQTLEQVASARVRGKTTHLDADRTTKQLQDELTQLTQKKNTLTTTLKRLEQEEITAQRVVSVVAPTIHKNTAKEGQLKRQLRKLESDIQKLTADIVADEARLKKEKATLAHEESEVKVLEQELMNMESHKQNVVTTPAPTQASVRKEQKIRQEEEQTKTLLSRLELSIKEVMQKIKDSMSRGVEEKAQTQKNDREKMTAQQALHVAEQKLLDRDRRLKILDTDLRTKKEKKEKMEAELRTLK